jgi:hypothetical protein
MDKNPINNFNPLPHESETDFMVAEWENLMKRVSELPPAKSVDTIRTWGKIIRDGLDIEVWKN